MNINRLKNALAHIYMDGVGKKDVQHMYRLFKNESPNNATSFNPNMLADTLHLSREQLFNIIVRGLVHELLEMHWVVNCHHCAAIVNGVRALQELSDANYCQRCQVRFDNFADHNIIVELSLHPQILNRSEPHKAGNRHDYQHDNRPPLTALELSGYPQFREK
ncbi:MAG: hypothetical protein GF313_04075 [Caldithrix sp.]|nr:hypothetical protein [Caldithrix sp.]